MGWVEIHRRLARGEARGGGDHFLAALLWPLAQLYRFGVRIRNSAYDLNLLPKTKIKPFVISVGGLAAGGSGKTPFCALIASHLAGEGFAPAIVARGYGATRRDNRMRLISSGTGSSPLETWRTAGEEAVLLGRLAPTVPVLIGTRRELAPIIAARSGLTPELLILDGGFQYRRLFHDFSIVLIDCSIQPRAGRLLPLGDLREPLKNINRADHIVLHRAQLCPSRGQWETCLDEIAPRIPRSWCRNQIRGLYPLGGWNQPVESCPEADSALAEYQGKPLGVWTALGHPEAFLGDLAALGLDIIWSHFARDHAPVNTETVALLNAACSARGLSAILVTEKDAVKLEPFAKLLPPILVAAAVLELENAAVTFWPAILKGIAGHKRSGSE